MSIGDVGDGDGDGDGHGDGMEMVKVMAMSMKMKMATVMGMGMVMEMAIAMAIAIVMVERMAVMGSEFRPAISSVRMRWFRNASMEVICLFDEFRKEVLTRLRQSLSLVDKHCASKGDGDGLVMVMVVMNAFIATSLLHKCIVCDLSPHI